jgi:hypothetical protein
LADPAQQTRILVACSMKSGSTFIAKVLALYFGAERIEPVPYWGRLEQNLHEHLIAPHLGSGFVIQMHVKPHVPNAELIRRLGMQVVWVWRNLGDVIVSFDDHIAQEDYRNPVCYVDDRERYLALPVQHRYRYLIEQALPWYIGFYLSWRRARGEIPFIETHYEDLAEDQYGYFARLIRALGSEVDEARLRSILATKLPGMRFNKGVNGRSAEALSADNQRLLDTTLLGHFEDLSALWLELPWRGAGLRAQGSFLAELARCSWNQAAGKVAFSSSGLRVEVMGEDFYFLVPGRVLAPAAGKTARLRLVVRGDTGCRFRLAQRGGLPIFGRRVRERVFRPTGEVQTVEFGLEDGGAEDCAFTLGCFQGGARPGTGEILEAVKYEG